MNSEKSEVHPFSSAPMRTSQIFYQSGKFRKEWKERVAILHYQEKTLEISRASSSSLKKQKLLTLSNYFIAQSVRTVSKKNKY